MIVYRILPSLMIQAQASRDDYGGFFSKHVQHFTFGYALFAHDPNPLATRS
jgi:hypothetical protein